jgi:hypothetical protein
LLKANTRTHREKAGLGISLGQLLSATRGASSPECQNRLYDIIRERRFDERPVINDYDSVQAMRDILKGTDQPMPPPTQNNEKHLVRASLKPRVALAQVRHY